MSTWKKTAYLLAILAFFHTPANAQKDESDPYGSLEQTNTTSSTTKTEDEFGEFVPIEEASSGSGADDEFGEFESFEQSDSTQVEKSCSGEKSCSEEKRRKNFLWVLGALLMTIIAGFLVRSKKLTALRGPMLLASLLVFGFYLGGCPCPIMSMQHGILFVLGEEVHWQQTVWFLALIPITYIFGKVWCGWVCHLGALQEFIFLPGRVKILQSRKAQNMMRYIRMALLIALIVQLVITHTNWYKEVDPFKVAFNLMSPHLTGWILLALLLISSVFIYRPFCKTICPIGLVLGWITKIPGASVLGIKGKCTGCVSCNRSCKINAITRDEKFSKLDNQECIACGECTHSCHEGVLQFTRKSKEHEDEFVCKRL